MYAFRTLSKPSALLAATTLALALGSAGCKKAAAPPSDDAMTTALHSRLAADGALGSEPIHSSVKDGVATLDGTVSNDAARSLAAADAAQIPGVRTVVNNLTVQPSAPPVATAAPPTPAPVEAPREARRPEPRTTKPAPIVRQRPQSGNSSEQATTAPPPPGENMGAPVSRPAPPPPAPAIRNLTIPAGTSIPVRITQTLSSATSQIGDRFTGSVASDIMVDGVTAIPAGSSVSGQVSDVQEAAHYKGSSLLSVQLTGINRQGNRLTVASDPYTLRGKGRGKNTAEKVGGGAALGAILGGIFGGGKGAAIGAAAGGGVGAGANTITKGEQVQIPSESLVRFSLTSPVIVRVSSGNAQGDGGASAPALQRRPDNQPPQ